MKLSAQITILATLVLTSGFFADAQLATSELITLLVDPPNPSPGETFQVKTNAPTFNPYSSRFNWALDGRARPDLSGFGKHTISLTAGEVGTVTEVSLNVESVDGRTGSADAFIRPAELILHWSAKTYAPRWYKGKKAPTSNAVVKVVALPRVVSGGVVARPENLTYRWSLDNQKNVLVGVGERVFSIKTSDLPKTSHLIRLEVEDRNSTVFKKAQIAITNSAPKVVLYRRTPLGGIETRSALTGGFAPSQRGLLDFQAEPFFFASPASREGLSFGWTVSGVEAAGAPDNPHILTLDTGREPVSSVPISVRVDDRDPLISAIVKTISLILQ